jgi:hypothetical protein
VRFAAIRPVESAMASSLNKGNSIELGTPDIVGRPRKIGVMGASHLLFSRSVHRLASLMSNHVHTHRLSVSLLLAAVVVAAALPMIGAFGFKNATEVEAVAHETESSPVVVAMPAPAVPYQPGNAVHSASMMIVGTLLIGLGSVVRRAA